MASMCMSRPLLLIILAYRITYCMYYHSVMCILYARDSVRSILCFSVRLARLKDELT
jgi:hypothetical protein